MDGLPSKALTEFFYRARVYPDTLCNLPLLEMVLFNHLLSRFDILGSQIVATAGHFLSLLHWAPPVRMV